MIGSTIRHVRRVAQRPIQPVTIQQLLARSATASDHDHVQHARWLRDELPVRLAHRLQDFLQLPYVAVTNSNIHEVFGLFMSSFEALTNCRPIQDVDNVQEFAEALHEMVEGYSEVIPKLREGYNELQGLFDDMVDLDTFLNKLFTTRIGNRVLAEHFLAVNNARENGTTDERKGIVHPNCSPAEIVGSLADRVGAACHEAYGVQPQVALRGQLDTVLAFIPEHLDFILQEILKNACRATIETHLDQARDLHPVVVEVMRGSFDVMIKVSDRGGGMRREKLVHVWKYGYSSVKNLGERNHIAGYGFGLPLSQAYAKYFGGDIHVESMYGYGTDVYINITNLGSIHLQNAAQGSKLAAS